MGCPDIEMLERYVRGELDGAQRGEVEEHLAGCDECRKLAAELGENEKLLGVLKTAVREVAGESGVSTVEQAQALLGERYRVIRRVGAGAAGQVYQASDNVLDRLVAIKFLRKRRGEEEQAEPWREARLASRMNHLNIAQVYEVGQAGEERFMVMEWVDGMPITDAWKGMSLEQRLGIYLGAAEAVSAAHRRGIVHRDLKPSNIIVTGGVTPKVLDFGIAHEWWSREGVEETVFRGTPAYCAPEQITVPVKISPATDVFALGILLYQLLTDALPFPQREQKKLFDAIRNEYPELPSAIQARTPIALQNICLKALEKDATKRYADAQGLCDDIRRYLRGEKVWSRPSFLVDKVQQEVFYHRQQLAVWHQNELITQKEYDRLEGIYEAMIAPPDPSIIEARQLSLSQVCLYLGGWLAVLGSFVLFYKSWEQIPLYWRPAPAIAATVLMIVAGLAMWRRAESRLAVGILATANLLVPVTMLLTMGQWNIMAASAYPWGTESVAEVLENFETHVVVGNLQVYLSAACWMAFSLVLLRLTRSSIFVVFSIGAFLAWLTSCYIIGDMQNWAVDVIAGRYLYPGVGLFILGTLLDRRGVTQYAWPPAVAGLGIIVLSLSGVALSPETLFGWVYGKPEFLSGDEAHVLSFVCNGVFYLALAGLCMRLGTRMQRWMAQTLNWLGPLHILLMLRILDSDKLDLAEGRRMVYRFILPFASLGFVFASVTRQMKSFFFSGLAGVAISVHKLTIEHLDKFFAWPVSLIVTGMVWMVVSWLVPRWKASSAIKKAG